MLLLVSWLVFVEILCSYCILFAGYHQCGQRSTCSMERFDFERDELDVKPDSLTHSPTLHALDWKKTTSLHRQVTKIYKGICSAFVVIKLEYNPKLLTWWWALAFWYNIPITKYIIKQFYRTDRQTNRRADSCKFLLVSYAMLCICDPITAWY